MLHILTYSTDDKQLEYLINTSKRHGVNVSVIRNSVWNGFSDKIKGLLSCIDQFKDDDVICFIDAYDVLINSTEADVLSKFYKFNADFVLSSELNCFPFKYRDAFELSQWTNFHYVNSGGFIGLAHAVKRFLRHKPLEDMEVICQDGGDQSYLIEYYLENKASDRIVIDHGCEIFLSMVYIEWTDISLYRGRIYNDVLKNAPSFVHFNGGSSRMALTGETVLPGLVRKLELSENVRSHMKIDEWKQLRNLPWPRIPQI